MSRTSILTEEAGRSYVALRLSSDILDQIELHALDDIQMSPEVAVLAGLWIAIAPRDKFTDGRARQLALTDITLSYANAMRVMTSTMEELAKMRSDSKDFLDHHVGQALVWQDRPLNVTIETMKGSMWDLEYARQRFDEAGRNNDQGRLDRLKGFLGVGKVSVRHNLMG